ncbi:MAG: hypothetical protein LPK38_04880, partial [Actinomycetes bacterium]|nr:hypothetical protein [Actinomycetes bacterium]MDX5380616.1 hypothetical protein [Actinomycetes bacterium]MDX5399556.1 hypothetical protein [Actinomycetes bacterium]MDX5450359.1 hypothetical protein [Actinomycetes bacterium]
MRKTTTTVAALALTALALTGCSNDAAQSSAAGSAASSAEAAPMLAEHGLDGMDTTAVIDRLDRLPLEERPTDLMASVRPDELVV